MKCSDIIALIEKDYPPERAEDWDNPGLLAGRSDREVKKIVVALDAVDEVVDFAVREGAQMLFTHHPLIFGSVRKINDGDFIGRRLLKLIENGISYYAAHTNYDICRMAYINGQQTGLKNSEPLEVTGEDGELIGLGRVGDLEEQMTLGELAEHIKKTMDIESVRVYGPASTMIKRAAVCGGAGKSVLSCALEKKADVFITGDIGYHTGIDALADGLCVIDADHFGTEHCFIHDAAERLRELCPDLEVIEADQKFPFFIV